MPWIKNHFLGVQVYSKWISTSTYFRFFSVLVPYLHVLLYSTMHATSPRILHIHPSFSMCPALVAESHNNGSLKCLETHMTACPGPVQHFLAGHPGPRLLLTSCPPTLGCFPGGASGKMPANAGLIRDTGSIPGSGRSPRAGNGNPLQYSYLGNIRGAWWATAMGWQRFGHDWALETYLFIYLAALHRMQDQVRQPSIDPKPPAMEGWSLVHWITREVPLLMYNRFTMLC